MGSAKVQIGAKLLCKGAKVEVTFRVSGTGCQVGVQVRVLNLDLMPNT